MKKYLIFLRGINVGGHHKVPMADLKKELQSLGYQNVVTILNSGNIILDAESEDLEGLENTISNHLENHFGFPIPAMVRTVNGILELHQRNPFEGIEVMKEIRLYISLLKMR